MGFVILAIVFCLLIANTFGVGAVVGIIGLSWFLFDDPWKLLIGPGIFIVFMALILISDKYGDILIKDDLTLNGDWGIKKDKKKRIEPTL